MVTPLFHLNMLELISGKDNSRGLRPYGSPEIELDNVAHYFEVMKEQHIILDHDTRQKAVNEQATALAQEVGGRIPDDAGLLAEVTNLIEAPTAFRGAFSEEYLELPTRSAGDSHAETSTLLPR